ncbi:MAG: hypothetical protein NZT61_04630 [Deltaproteobacteria bacterium]|nr:hypothetical protein [Deltaproteobacteria bacterium]MCX7952165.1 hypothetical protein [Deltaproteobacteria bacterium]
MLELSITFIVASILSFVVYKLKMNIAQNENIADVEKQLKDCLEELENIQSESRVLIHQEEAEEHVSLIEEFSNISRLEKSKLNIASLEVTSLENRLREFTDVEQEIENSSLETREIVKAFRNNFLEISQKMQTLGDKRGIWIEALARLFPESKDRIDLLDDFIKKFESLSEVVEKSVQCIEKLKTRFDALDIEFAELYEKFGELEV